MLAMCLKNKNIAALAQPLIFHIGTRLPTQSSDRPKEKKSVRHLAACEETIT